MMDWNGREGGKIPSAEYQEAVGKRPSAALHSSFVIAAYS